MSQVLEVASPPTALNRLLARFEGLKRRLPGGIAEREAAAARLRTVGLPTIAEEDWHYTSLRSLETIRFDEALTPVGEYATSGEKGSPAAILAELGLPDAPRFVFVDGRYAPDLSTIGIDAPLPAGVSIARFAAEPRFDGAANPGRETMVALNTMLAEDGVVIDVADGVEAGTIVLVSLGAHVSVRPITYHPRHRIRVGRGASLAMIEVAAGTGAYLANPVTEITVLPDAHLSHVRLQDEDRSAFHFATTYVDVAERGTYDSFCLNLGGAITRTEIHARLSGPKAMAHLNGAQLLTGRQHADFTTVVGHVAPDCGSRQTVKNVLAGHSRGVFQGRIDVAREAQKTDGYQMNQALLLSEHAEIDSKPQLRINADDVKCSHGATVGELDHAQLFYLRSRGVPAPAARAILVRAFLAEAIDPIVNEDGRALLERAVERWWLREGAEMAAS